MPTPRDLLRAELRQVLDVLKQQYWFGDASRVLKIAEAALNYGDSNHTGDANCCAGDHDSCTAKDALAKLEELLGGPSNNPIANHVRSSGEPE